MNLSSLFSILVIGTSFCVFPFSCSGKNKSCTNPHNSRKQSFTNQILPSVQVNGGTSFEDTKVIGLAKINGKAKIKHSFFGNLNVNDRASLNHSTVEKDTEINGTAKIEFCFFGSLTINGEGIVQDSHINQKATLNGATQIIRSSFDFLEINGQATLDQVIIEKEAEINVLDGNLETKSVCCPIMQTCALQTSLEKSNIGVLTRTPITKNGSFSKKKPVITLTDTTVEKIVFEHTPGKVLLKGSTELTPEQVINGIIE